MDEEEYLRGLGLDEKRKGRKKTRVVLLDRNMSNLKTEEDFGKAGFKKIDKKES